ncbi:MAG: hypothetical protein J7623_07460 [Chitinophaga sp.]|uniref:hypothetical protein n=1 Tax=Chitinophaga sp. TaxID=1869181 RepID=UPI001B2F06A4|nr:hypothetical protein [Chitinophaga sp.]MBO9728462.1 hypothetical protein [Chitinophaga sp.]
MASFVKKGNKVFIDYKYLIGITASFRQVDLSLDRSRWNDWEELCLFYKERSDAEYFFDFFIGVCKQLNLSPKYYGLSWRSYRVDAIVSRIFRRFFLPQNYVTIQELETGYYLLNEFKGLLANKSTEPKDMEPVRYRIAVFYANWLWPKLKRRDYWEVMKVEHYFQNERLVTRSLEELTGFRVQ